jgi:hypothetical protein
MSPAEEGCSMTDLIFILVIVAFFAFSGLYVKFCDKL